MDWFRTYQDGILRGSLSQANEIVQLIWVKLLAIENETRARDGWLHYAPGQPMTHTYLAEVCSISVDWLEEALQVFLGDYDDNGRPRIKIADDGDIFLMNWEHYQAKPPRVVAKEIAIEKAKRTGKSREAATAGIMRAVNELNITKEEIKKIVSERKDGGINQDSPETKAALDNLKGGKQ